MFRIHAPYIPIAKARGFTADFGNLDAGAKAGFSCIYAKGGIHLQLANHYISAKTLANSFIQLSLNENIQINTEKLQAMMFYVCKKWKNEKGTLLLTEDFIKENGAYRLISLDSYFGCLGIEPITRYARFADDRCSVIRKDCEIYPFVAFVFWDSIFRPTFEVRERASVL